MNISKAKKEMLSMSEQLCKDADHWQLSIKNGQETMKLIKTIYSRLFATEELLNNADSRKGLQATEKRINNLYVRLQRPLATMTKILESLTEVRDNTARMLNRLTLWMDDEIVSEHRIQPNLKSSELLTVLQFLRQRYDAEWEVKEMVVNDLEHINSSYELEFLVDGWDICRHAGGPEFAKTVRNHYRIVGRS
ncbi:uncharacterized protein LOC108028275 [Drosophila biarmipes]|uniref:uncharacterized protein LOC108028275 n=1 Tax=Drosophila biarmipes TaxID=125945 RepID=UPI0007E87E04|nr:uncharacterized protein LOC108028275 [Drosophila biarmipes]